MLWWSVVVYFVDPQIKNTPPIELSQLLVTAVFLSENVLFFEKTKVGPQRVKQGRDDNPHVGVSL